VISSRSARAGVLAAIALIAVAVVLVVLHARHGPSSTGGPWYSALAAPYAPADGETTSCGKVFGPNTIGVAHPVLPCGAKLELEFGGKHVVVRVIDRHPTVPGHTFDLTPALAKELGIVGTQTIQWRFAT
jgi:rare lipoprotein A (peptidoglycan hydrolase)